MQDDANLHIDQIIIWDLQKMLVPASRRRSIGRRDQICRTDARMAHMAYRRGRPPAIRSSSSEIQVQDLALPDKPSIVILPFDNMSAEAGKNYLADEIVEAITYCGEFYPNANCQTFNRQSGECGSAAIRRSGLANKRG